MTGSVKTICPRRPFRRQNLPLERDISNLPPLQVSSTTRQMARFARQFSPRPHRSYVSKISSLRASTLLRLLIRIPSSFVHIAVSIPRIFPMFIYAREKDISQACRKRFTLVSSSSIV